MITRNIGAVLIQEIVNWGCDQLIDCLTLFSRRETFTEPIRPNNPVFMAEAKLIQSFQSHYSALWSGQQTGSTRPVAATA